jgi:hypothetical protein
VADTNTVLEVDRTDFGKTRLVDEELPELDDDQVRVRIERFALTANNVTYATVGDLLGYWDFFPAADGWGRVPAMGWAEIVESNHPDIGTGARFYGWYPMARFVDFTASPTATGFRDDGAHRQAHAAVYRGYTSTDHDPFHEPGDDAEDRHALLRGLFLTGLLADEFFADDGYLGASHAVVLSASSKTAIGFAQRAASRGLERVIGLTSRANLDFVGSLGWYDQVLAYDQLDQLPASGDAVSIDMSGDSGVLAGVHAHFGDRLKYSMVIGRSHHDAPPVEVTGGPTPLLFFAPSEIDRRMAEWGPDEYARRTTGALHGFVAGSHDWLTVERVAGAEAAEAAYHEIYDGRLAPSVGRIVSMHDA